MKKEHGFLYQIFCEKKGWKNRATLHKATPQQVWVVLRLLFCVAVGHIPLTKSNYQKLLRSKRNNTLTSLKTKMQSLRQAETGKKRDFILQFASLYPYLFHDIFVPPHSKKT